MGGLVEQMEAGGRTPLYDAIKQAIEITHAAEGEHGRRRGQWSC